MYSVVKTKSLKRCNSCLESKFSQQTNLSMKISILGSISAENEDKRSMKITLEIMLCYKICKTVPYLIFVHHEGEPIQVFYSTKKMQLSRFITDTYINNILTALSTYSNIVGHVHGPTLKRPPYYVHKYFMTQHVLSRNFRKNRNSGWLTDILHCNLWAS